MSRRRYKAQDFIAAIDGSGGIISTISRRIGCDWHTAKKWVEGHATVRRAYEAECDKMLDLAESILLASIKDGNSADAKWYLSKKGKARGYTDSLAVEADISTNIRVVEVMLSEDDK